MVWLVYPPRPLLLMTLVLIMLLLDDEEGLDVVVLELLDVDVVEVVRRVRVVVHTVRFTADVPLPRLSTVVPMLLLPLAFPRVLPSPLRDLMIGVPMLLLTALVPLPSSPLAWNVRVLVLPCTLIDLWCPWLLLVRVLVL